MNVLKREAYLAIVKRVDQDRGYVWPWGVSAPIVVEKDPVANLNQHFSNSENLFLDTCL
jgi:hypothetical protein